MKTKQDKIFIILGIVHAFGKQFAGFFENFFFKMSDVIPFSGITFFMLPHALFMLTQSFQPPLLEPQINSNLEL